MGVAPETLERTAEVVVAALRPGIGRDWSRRAGTLEWSVETTIAHMAGVSTAKMKSPLVANESPHLGLCSKTALCSSL